MLVLIGESRNVRWNLGEVLKDHEQIVTLLQRAARDANLSNLLVDRKDAEAHKLGRDGASKGLNINLDVTDAKRRKKALCASGDGQSLSDC